MYLVPPESHLPSLSQAILWPAVRSAASLTCTLSLELCHLAGLAKPCPLLPCSLPLTLTLCLEYGQELRPSDEVPSDQLKKEAILDWGKWQQAYLGTSPAVAATL
jgi:hypothetical protein